MLRSRSFDLVNRKLDDEDQNDRKTTPKLKGSYGADLYALEQDRAIRTEPEETSRRRTIRLERELPQSWGFTLQTYGIRNKKTGEIEVMSYVDYIDIHGSAWMSGMRTGDIILSVNGESVENTTHVELVQKIQQCRLDMRLVVLFENCCRKVELHERYLKLKKMIAQKFIQVQDLEEEEKKIRQGIHVSRLGYLRHSNGSSISSDWDIYSAVTSPTMLNGTPLNQFAFRETQSEHDTTSCDSSPLESSRVLNQWERNASSEEICSSNLDLHTVSGHENFDDSREFLHSGQSDISEISEASDNGLRKLYNITRCAQRISDAGRSEGILAFDEDESILKNEGSMINLVEDSGIELKEVKVLGQGKGKNLFFIESDSEDSILNSEPDSRVLHDFKINSGSPSEAETERNVENVKDSMNDNVPKCNDNDTSSHFDTDHNVKVDNTDTGSNGNKTDNFDTSGSGQDEILRKTGVKNDNDSLRGPNYSRPVSEESTTSSCTLSDPNYCRTVSDDSSTSSSSSRSDTSNTRQSIEIRGTDELSVFQQQTLNLEDPSSITGIHSSTPLSHYSKHGEYNVRGARPVSLSKRQMKSSETIGATPVLISYKKEEDECHDEIQKNDNSTTKYKKHHGSKEAVSVIGNCSLNVIQEDSSSSKSDSGPSLSSAGDSSCGDDESSETIQCHDNDQNCNSYRTPSTNAVRYDIANTTPQFTKSSPVTSSSLVDKAIPTHSIAYSSGTTVITIKQSDGAAGPPGNAVPAKGSGQIPNATSHQSERFVQGILVNNLTQSTHL